MNMLITMSMLTVLISNIIIMISSVISKKLIIDREKITPFECGFDPFFIARAPFSLKFFLIAVIFLIFDVEIAIILPAMMTFQHSSPWEWMITFFMFILILLVGLYHEWYQGALSWTK